jgi:hypothetical protein
MEDKMNTKEWLLDNADIPIKYILTKDKKYLENLLGNFEVTYWLSQLKPRSENKNIGDIHGSHDYRMENILGKCWILGLSKVIPVFSQYLEFIIDFLNKHINEHCADKLSFNKIYSYRDYETVLACFLSVIGFADEAAIKYICEKRINILYNFTKQKRYDIYVDGSKYKGIKMEWQPYIIYPDLYADGNIALPDMHDFILFSGMYDKFDKENKNKIEAIVKWIFEDKYMDIIGRYGYFYVPGGAYNVKAIITKINLIDFKTMSFDNGDLCGLLFMCYILSRFESAKRSEWFKLAMKYLNNYKTPDNRYIFPKYMIMEKTDCYVIGGGHMNIGEDKKSKKYSEIISTYWMDKIQENV